MHIKNNNIYKKLDSGPQKLESRYITINSVFLAIYPGSNFYESWNLRFWGPGY